MNRLSRAFSRFNRPVKVVDLFSKASEIGDNKDRQESANKFAQLTSDDFAAGSAPVNSSPDIENIPESPTPTPEEQDRNLQIYQGEDSLPGWKRQFEGVQGNVGRRGSMANQKGASPTEKAKVDMMEGESSNHNIRSEYLTPNRGVVSSRNTRNNATFGEDQLDGHSAFIHGPLGDIAGLPARRLNRLTRTGEPKNIDLSSGGKALEGSFVDGIVGGLSHGSDRKMFLQLVNQSLNGESGFITPWSDHLNDKRELLRGRREETTGSPVHINDIPALAADGVLHTHTVLDPNTGRPKEMWIMNTNNDMNQAMRVRRSGGGLQFEHFVDLDRIADHEAGLDTVNAPMVATDYFASDDGSSIEPHQRKKDIQVVTKSTMAKLRSKLDERHDGRNYISDDSGEHLDVPMSEDYFRYSANLVDDLVGKYGDQNTKGQWDASTQEYMNGSSRKDSRENRQRLIASRQNQIMTTLENMIGSGDLSTLDQARAEVMHDAMIRNTRIKGSIPAISENPERAKTLLSSLNKEKAITVGNINRQTPEDDEGYAGALAAWRNRGHDDIGNYLRYLTDEDKDTNTQSKYGNLKILRGTAIHAALDNSDRDLVNSKVWNGSQKARSRYRSVLWDTMKQLAGKSSIGWQMEGSEGSPEDIRDSSPEGKELYRQATQNRIVRAYQDAANDADQKMDERISNGMGYLVSNPDLRHKYLGRVASTLRDVAKNISASGEHHDKAVKFARELGLSSEDIRQMADHLEQHGQDYDSTRYVELMGNILSGGMGALSKNSQGRLVSGVVADSRKNASKRLLNAAIIRSGLLADQHEGNPLIEYGQTSHRYQQPGRALGRLASNAGQITDELNITDKHLSDDELEKMLVMGHNKDNAQAMLDSFWKSPRDFREGVRSALYLKKMAMQANHGKAISIEPALDDNGSAVLGKYRVGKREFDEDTDEVVHTLHDFLSGTNRLNDNSLFGAASQLFSMGDDVSEHDLRTFANKSNTPDEIKDMITSSLDEGMKPGQIRDAIHSHISDAMSTEDPAELQQLARTNPGAADTYRKLSQIMNWKPRDEDIARLEEWMARRNYPAMEHAGKGIKTKSQEGYAGTPGIIGQYIRQLAPFAGDGLTGHQLDVLNAVNRSLNMQEYRFIDNIGLSGAKGTHKPMSSEVYGGYTHLVNGIRHNVEDTGTEETETNDINGMIDAMIRRIDTKGVREAFNKHHYTKNAKQAKQEIVEEHGLIDKAIPELIKAINGDSNGLAKASDLVGPEQANEMYAHLAQYKDDNDDEVVPQHLRNYVAALSKRDAIIRHFGPVIFGDVKDSHISRHQKYVDNLTKSFADRYGHHQINGKSVAQIVDDVVGSSKDPLEQYNGFANFISDPDNIKSLQSASLDEMRKDLAYRFRKTGDSSVGEAIGSLRTDNPKQFAESVNEIFKKNGINKRISANDIFSPDDYKLEDNVDQIGEHLRNQIGHLSVDDPVISDGTNSVGEMIKQNLEDTRGRLVEDRYNILGQLMSGIHGRSIEEARNLGFELDPNHPDYLFGPNNSLGLYTGEGPMELLDKGGYKTFQANHDPDGEYRQKEVMQGATRTANMLAKAVMMNLVGQMHHSLSGRMFGTRDNKIGTSLNIATRKGRSEFGPDVMQKTQHMDELQKLTEHMMLSGVDEGTLEGLRKNKAAQIPIEPGVKGSPTVYDVAGVISDPGETRKRLDVMKETLDNDLKNTLLSGGADSRDDFAARINPDASRTMKLYFPTLYYAIKDVINNSASYTDANEMHNKILEGIQTVEKMQSHAGYQAYVIRNAALDSIQNNMQQFSNMHDTNLRPLDDIIGVVRPNDPAQDIVTPSISRQFSVADQLSGIGEYVGRNKVSNLLKTMKAIGPEVNDHMLPSLVAESGKIDNPAIQNNLMAAATSDDPSFFTHVMHNLTDNQPKMPKISDIGNKILQSYRVGAIPEMMRMGGHSFSPEEITMDQSTTPAEAQDLVDIAAQIMGQQQPRGTKVTDIFSAVSPQYGQISNDVPQVIN